jgi:hypothetical protein
VENWSFAGVSALRTNKNATLPQLAASSFAND